MSSKLILGAAGIAALVYFLRQREDSLPVTITPVPDSEVTTPGASGLSIGWAPEAVKIAPVRAVFEESEWVRDTPTNGRFFILEKRFSLEKVAKAMIFQVATEAGERRSLDAEDVQQWASEMSRDPVLIKSAEDLLHCSGWNDELYGSPNPERTGPHGRGIEIKAVHDDVLSCLVRGGTPRRNLDANGKVVSHGPRNRPMIWIPAINPDIFGEVIIDGRPVEAVTTAGMVWEDKSSTLWPPPAVSCRGVIHGKN